MFIKVTQSGPRRYLQLVEAYRDELGRPKQRTVATLGRLDQLGDSIRSMHGGLSRILGVDGQQSACNGIKNFDSARAFGDLWALNCIWKQLKLDQLNKLLSQRTRHQIDLEALFRIMVFNRLSDAQSKLGVLRWLQTVSLPDIAIQSVGHQQLLRTMDALLENQELIESTLAKGLGPLVNLDLSVVFYDMTTIGVEGLSTQEDELRHYGISKDGGIARQFMLGLVQTAEGIPLYHEVFQGNTAEVGTLKDSLKKVMARYPIQRVIAVADRGLLSLSNLDQLKSMSTPSGKPLEFILAVPGRRYSDFVELLEPITQKAAESDKVEIIEETHWEGLRLVIAHNQQRAAEQTESRDQKIAALEAQAAQWAGKLDTQDSGARTRGRSLSDGGARAKFYHAVSEARLGKIIKVDLKSELFTYQIDDHALALARAMDGKLLLVSNVKDLEPEQIVSRYKSLADIERGFKVLKSEIEIGPVHHRLPDRIRAHALICFVALVIQRVIRGRLQQSPVEEVVSPERALSVLRQIQTHRVNMENGKPVTGLSQISDQQLTILTSLQVPKPSKKAKYANL